MIVRPLLALLAGAFVALALVLAALPEGRPLSALIEVQTPLWATVVAFFGVGVVTAVGRERKAAWRFATAAGLGPLLLTLTWMVVEGPGTLWPLALGLSLGVGLLPAVVGAAAGLAVGRPKAPRGGAIGPGEEEPSRPARRSSATHFDLS